MSTKNTPGHLRKTALILAVAISISALLAYAVLFNVTLTDIVLILDDASLRQTAKDNLLPTDNASQNNQNAADSLLTNDNAYLSNQNAADSLLLTDDTYQNNQNAADSMGFTDSAQPSSQAKEVLALTAFASRNFLVVIDDNFALTDQTSGVEIPDLPDTEQEDERRSGGKSDRIVFDELYFDTHPQSRLQIKSLYIVDPDNSSVLMRVGVREDVSIAATVRNYQAISQNCTLVAQITDENGVAIDILLEPGIIASGNTAKIEQTWRAETTGVYKIEVMIWDSNLQNPSLLSNSTDITVFVS